MRDPFATPRVPRALRCPGCLTERPNPEATGAVVVVEYVADLPCSECAVERPRRMENNVLVPDDESIVIEITEEEIDIAISRAVTPRDEETVNKLLAVEQHVRKTRGKQ